jgi:hypothetical protein
MMHHNHGRGRSGVRARRLENNLFSSESFHLGSLPKIYGQEGGDVMIFSTTLTRICLLFDVVVDTQWMVANAEQLDAAKVDEGRSAWYRGLCGTEALILSLVLWSLNVWLWTCEMVVLDGTELTLCVYDELGFG